MNYFFVAVFLVMSLGTSASASSSWKLKNNFAVSKVWQHASDSKLYVSIEKTKVDDSSQYKNMLKDKAALASFEAHKKSLLGLIGVTKWSAPSKEWTKINGRDFLKIQGTYTDNSEETVFFKEFHLVEDGNVLQVLFTSTSNASYSITSQADIEQFLKEIKMDTISE